MDSKHYHDEDTTDCCYFCHKTITKGISYALSRFHILLNRTFFNLGKTVAQYKGYFIIIPLFLTALAATGFQRIEYEDDPEYLFAPSTGPARGERALIENYFSLNFSSLFDPTRITRTGRFARFIITAKDAGTVLKKSIWDEIMELDSTIKDIRVAYNKKTYTFEDLCAIRDGKCFKNDVLGLSKVITEVENGSFELQYPINLEPFLLPHFFGGIQTDDRGEVLKSAKGILLYYWIRTNTDEEKERGIIWEKMVLGIFAKKEFKLIDVARFTSRTLEDELENNTNSVKPFVPVTLTLMTLFSVFVCLMGDWVRGKPYIGVVGVLTSVFSSFASFGLLIYLGVPFIGINMAAPFLMLGIGIDDTFVLLAAWRRTRLQDSVPQRLAETYSDAAVSITITSLTDMISFCIGILTPFPSVQIFCIYTGTAVLATYIWHITLFGGCLAVAGYAERGKRHSIFCFKVKSSSEAERDNCFYRALCTGGISEKDPWNPKDNKPHIIMVMFRDYIGTMLNIPAIKTLVICVFILYLGGAIYGCTKVKEGLEKRRLSRYDSYSAEYYKKEDEFFRIYPYSIQVVLTGNITYSDPQTKEDILDLMAAFESQSYIDGNYTQSVIRNWYLFLEENAEWLDFNITDEKSYISYLREVYVSDPNDVLNLDIKYNDDFTQILASRFIIQTYKLENSNADKNMMEGLREIANESKFNVTVFNPFFVFFDQFVLVRTLTVQAISLAALIMMFISLIFIPNPWCSMWVAFSIISIEVGVVGFMSLWNVNLDSISMINLIMCIGFSVDFSAHISYAYLTARVDTPDERVKECLFALGLPIVQGGVSTILGVVALTLAPSYIFLTFFKIVFLVIFFGIVHGIFLLPVLLSLVGPGSFKKKDNRSLYDPDKFVQKGDLQTKAYPPPPYFNSLERRIDKKKINFPIESTNDAILQSGTFLTPPTPHSKGSSVSNEKDMGIGTSSGEDSSDVSLQDASERRGEETERRMGEKQRSREEKSNGLSFIEVKDDSTRPSRRGGGDSSRPSRSGRASSAHPLPIKALYSNKGFVSDTEDESQYSRNQHRRHKNLDRRNSHYTPSYQNGPIQRHYSDYFNHSHDDHRRKTYF